MIRHLVMWVLHRPEDAAYFKAQLDSCKPLVDGVSLLELDVGIKTEGLEGNCHVALNTLLRDASALEAYHNHPHHVLVKSNLKALAQARYVMDYGV
jgi:Stress responsive A/B Barrel Domain